MAFHAIKKQYKEVFDLVGVYSPKFVLDNLNVSSKPIQEFMNDYYPMFSDIAVMYRKEAIRQKNAEDDFYDSVYYDKLRHFALTQTGAKVTSITATTEHFIRGAIESAMTEGFEQGLGTDKMARLIRKHLTDSLGDIGRSRSRMIAQTEMVQGSNFAATEAINDTGFAYRKFWSTSGLPNIRDSHLQAESDSAKGIPADEAFSNGLMYPGDPNGAPEEVINCRCTVLHEII